MSDKTVLQDAAQAADSGDLEELKSLLHNHNTLVSEQDENADTLLGLACRAATGQIAIPYVAGTSEQHTAVDIILAAGANPNAATHEGWTPLHTAAMSGHTGLAARLIEAGASLDGRLYDCDGGSPLSLALFYAKTATADLLANPATPDNFRNAAGLGRSLARFINSEDGNELSPEASKGTEFYRPLLLFPQWQREYGRQELLDEALTWASRNGQCDAMAELVALGADVNSNAYRGTPLLWSVYDNRAAATQWLVDHGADPNLRHDFGGDGHGVSATAIHLAAQNGAIDSLRVLLDNGADPNIRDAAYDGNALGWAEFSDASASIALLKAER